MLAGVPTARLRSLAEPLSSAAVRAVADCARRHVMYVVAGFYVLEQDEVSNIAALFDRSGELVCAYSKIHPTEHEIDDGVIAGSEIKAFDTDFGRVDLRSASISTGRTCGGNWRRRASIWSAGSRPTRAGSPSRPTPGSTSSRSCRRCGPTTQRSSSGPDGWPPRLRAGEGSRRSTSIWTSNSSTLIATRICCCRCRSATGTVYGSRPSRRSICSRSRVSDPQLSVGDIVSEFGLTDYHAYIERSARKQRVARPSMARTAQLRELADG